MTTNDAAERLRAVLRLYPPNTQSIPLIDAALAAERRATVERIRAALKDCPPVHIEQIGASPQPDDCLYRSDFDDALDAEAE
jgi:predicted protein tyrosine phosphatase